jgi:ABC-type sugar transport system permease subunit
LWTLFFLAPALLVLIAFRLGASFLSLALSFFRGGIFGKLEFVGLANFIRLFGDGLFWASLANIGFYTLIHLSVSLVLGFLIALLMESLKGSSFFRNLLFVPLTLSLSGATWVFWMMLNYNIGVVPNLLNLILKLPKVDLIYGYPWGTLGVALITIWRNLGLFTLIYLARMRALDPALYEAAAVDGASFWQGAYYITLPLLRHTILFLLVAGLAISLQLFDPVFILRSQRLFSSTLGLRSDHVIPATYIYNALFRSFRLGFASSLSTVVFIISLSLAVAPAVLSRRKER